MPDRKQIEASEAAIPLPARRNHDLAAEGGNEDVVAKPPDGDFGWVVVFCLTAMNAATWGKYRTQTTVSDPRPQLRVWDLHLVLPYK